MEMIQIIMKYLNVINYSKSRYHVPFKLFLYVDKVSFNTKSEQKLFFH